MSMRSKSGCSMAVMIPRRRYFLRAYRNPEPFRIFKIPVSQVNPGIVRVGR